MKIFKILIGALVVLLALVLLFPLVYPINLYIPQLQKALSTQLRQPVTISNIAIAYTPMPKLVLENVMVGEHQEVQIKKALVLPAYLTLLSDQWVIKQLMLEGADVKQEFVMIAPIILNAGKGTGSFRIESVKFTESNIKMNHATLGPLNAEVAFDRVGGFKDILLSQEGNSATLRIAPKDGQYSFNFVAQAWAAPMAPAVKFGSLTVNALGNTDGLVIDDIRAVISGGTMVGSAKLEWADQWQLSGKYTLNNMQLESLTSSLSPKTFVAGRASMEGVFGSSGKYLEDLLLLPRAEANFKVEEGTLNNFDFITAIRYNAGAQGDSGLRGGKTRFDTMTGKLEISDKIYRFKSVAIQSGLLVANGGLVVAPDRKANGSFSVRIKSTVNPLAVPISVSGTLDSPLLRPTGSIRARPIETNSGATVSPVETE
ncbi:AsmA family protein [Chitinivorax sp. B]|uniref:AsmA family protein n=1 Tax=Chitinivorax sp. B TaxID=2502235 RepID=UPI0010F644C1|nr:AsmA family protein [Chitinivorax sp. B]